MIGILVGCAAVFGLTTTATGGNWRAGLVVSVVVFCSVVGGMRRRREELHREERAQAARDVVDALYAQPKRRWFR